ncbi:hypothetical protein [Streptomyces sp. AcE210]|uniref:hypothetical protein n=1 Tax=Streptomyces sp. AcE210 TaxID=2292703 RepID=UPI001404329D|nr:hypothetical protein [Streptomyces sp. AcE210]
MSALGHEIKDVTGMVDRLVDGLHCVHRIDHEVVDVRALMTFPPPSRATSRPMTRCP